MAIIKHYKELNTDLKNLFSEISDFLEGNPKLKVINKLEGKREDGLPFMSVIAIRMSIPRGLVGALREVRITIVGKPDDYFVEIHTGAWLHNLVGPGVVAGVLLGPVGGALTASSSGILAYEYQQNLKKKLRRLINKHSKNELTIDNVETV